MATNNLPVRPFDGQIYIDAFRVKWVFNSETRCWQRIGVVSDIPVASEVLAGLMSAQLKNTLDGTPDKGGHFGIITKPLPTIATQKTILFRDTVRIAFATEAGSTVRGNIPFTIDAYKAGEFRSKLLIFTSGPLIGEVYLIFDNTDRDLLLHGDAGGAKNNDKFEVVELDSFNPSGVLTGDIELVSESLEITCIDGNGDPVDLVNGKQCYICVDSPDEEKLAGLDIKVSDDFINEFCAVIPGCEGNRGAKGDKGDTGTPGTGDGPQGEQGDSGTDAPETPDEFTGIKINDIVDIFDTAIVNIELDAENNRINIIKAKVRTPDENSVATQLLTTPIDRDIKFIDDEFGYELLKPTIDAINDLDTTLLHYPEGSAPGAADLANQETQVGKIKLSGIIDRIIEFYKKKLDELSEEYDLELKTVIEEKDTAARTILADLAREVSDCEWSTPLSFCLGIEPNCFNPGESLGTFPFPMAEVLGGTTFSNATATDLGFIQIGPGNSIPVGAPPGVPTVSLPTDNAYLIQYLDGAIKTNNGYTVGDTTGNGTMLQIVSVDQNEQETTTDFPVPSSNFGTTSEDAVVDAYKGAVLQEMSVFVQFPMECPISSGFITINSVVGDGVDASGRINLRVLQVNRESFTSSGAGTVAGGPGNGLTIEMLTPPVECANFRIEVCGDQTIFAAETVMSAQITTRFGAVIPGAVGADNQTGAGFSQVIQFDTLPLGSFGPAVITVNIGGGPAALQDSISITIGTEL